MRPISNNNNAADLFSNIISLLDNSLVAEAFNELDDEKKKVSKEEVEKVKTAVNILRNFSKKSETEQAEEVDPVKAAQFQEEIVQAQRLFPLDLAKEFTYPDLLKLFGLMIVIDYWREHPNPQKHLKKALEFLTLYLDQQPLENIVGVAKELKGLLSPDNQKNLDLFLKFYSLSSFNQANSLVALESISATKEAGEVYERECLTLTVFCHFYHHCVKEIFQDLTQTKEKIKTDIKSTKEAHAQSLQGKGVNKKIGKGLVVFIDPKQVKLQQEECLNQVIRDSQTLEILFNHRFRLIYDKIESLKASRFDLESCQFYMHTFFKELQSYHALLSTKLSSIQGVISKINGSFSLASYINAKDAETKISESFYGDIAQNLKQLETFQQLMSFIIRRNKNLVVLYPVKQELGWTSSIDLLDNLQSLKEKTSPESSPSTGSKKKKAKKTPAKQVEKGSSKGLTSDCKLEVEEPVKYTINLDVPNQPKTALSDYEIFTKREKYLIDVINQHTGVNPSQLLLEISQLYQDRIKHVQQERAKEAVNLNSVLQKRFFLSQADMLHHISLGTCSFEVLIGELEKNHFSSLLLNLSNFILDISAQMELHESGEFILSQQKINHSHCIEELIQKNKRAGLFDETLKNYINQHSYGMIWTRYLHECKKYLKENQPEPIKHLMFAHELAEKFVLNEKIDLEGCHLKELISYVFKAQKNSRAYLTQLISQTASKEQLTCFHELRQAEEKLYAKMEKSLIKKLSQPMETSKLDKNPAFKLHQELAAAQDQSSRVFILGTNNPAAIVKDASSHLLRHASAHHLMQTYSSSHLAAWHFRHILNVQWSLELLLMSQSLCQGQDFMQTHNFTALQQSARPAGEMNSQILLFNVGKGVHYPCLAASENKQIKLLSQFNLLLNNSETQAKCAMGDTHLSSNTLNEFSDLFNLAMEHVKGEVKYTIIALKAAHQRFT